MATAALFLAISGECPLCLFLEIMVQEASVYERDERERTALSPFPLFPSLVASLSASLSLCLSLTHSLTTYPFFSATPLFLSPSPSPSAGTVAAFAPSSLPIQASRR